MPNVLVTGGAGFIGSHLVRRLASEGFTIDVVDNMSNGSVDNLSGLNIRCLLPALLDVYEAQFPERSASEIRVIEGDFSSPAILGRISKHSYDAVFHLAAVPMVSYSVENPADTTSENLMKSVQLLEACAGSVKRVIISSTCAIYGDTDTFPTSEETPRSPASPYALQKACLEDFAKLFGRLYDLDTVNLRYFNVFGPGQTGSSPYSTVIAAWCNAIADGRSLRFDGDGTQSRDMCFIDNIVDANILALRSEKNHKGECYNICSGVNVTNSEILSFLSERFSELEVVRAPKRAGDIMKSLGDFSAAKRDLGYLPKVTFWDGLEKTLKWWNLK
jgi:nucleoside-diphosphate-sugar epimerase